MAVFLWREPQVPAKEDSLLVMFWNLENFFDWKVDTTVSNTSDEEFSSSGKRHWTKRRFLVKCGSVAKSVFWIADRHGMLPDVIGLAEIENRFALDRLLAETPLRRMDYGIVHYESPDPRGIDVALLYRKRRLKPLVSKPLKIKYEDGSPLLTRDILLAGFLKSDGDSVVFLVNHHPSKYGANSSWRREAAMSRLGNNTPSSTLEYSKTMVNLAAPLARKGHGTIKYSGKWEMIDMFFISPEIMAANPGIDMTIERIPFLTVKDNTHSGEKPLRTYSGPRYLGGVSDHCPITVVIK